MTRHFALKAMTGLTGLSAVFTVHNRVWFLGNSNAGEWSRTDLQNNKGGPLCRLVRVNSVSLLKKYQLQVDKD